jgi:hypothetical protein
MKLDDIKARTRILGCSSDFEVGDYLGKIEIDGFKGLTQLDAAELRSTTPDPGIKAQRSELITAIRGGKHVELAVTARTFRQKKGKPNRRYLRLGGDLAASAKTFAKTPFLVDHNTHEQSARKGSILTSKLVEGTNGFDEFEMSFNIVKPDAVISALDGTLDQFSIGWFALGPVICSVHKADVRGRASCSCWPGDVVEVDGKAQIVEYEFTAWQGKELSGVNIPAVEHTNISDIRAALSAELDLSPSRHQPTQEQPKMALTRLAAVLGLTALADPDEDRALAAVEALSRRASAAEQDSATLRTQLTASELKVKQAETALTAATAASSKVRVDGMIKAAYDGGKLRWGRDDAGKPVPSGKEARLRRIAKEDGLDALTAEIAEMEVVVPVRQRLQSDEAGEPEKKPIGAPSELADNPYIASVAAQLGLKVEDMVGFADQKGGE